MAARRKTSCLRSCLGMIVLGGLIIIFFVVVLPSGDKEPSEGVLSSADITAIQSRLQEAFDDEKEFAGHEFRLGNVEYDSAANQLNITVDYQVDPVLPAEELIETNEAWAWLVAEAMPGISEKDFNIRVTAVTKVGDDEFIFWGSTRYTYRDGKYTFNPGPGMDLLD